MAGMSVPGNSCFSCSPPNNSGCLFTLADKCIYYSGTNITGPGINTADNLQVVIVKLVNYINSQAGSTTTTTSTTAHTTSTTTTTTTTGVVGQGTIQFMWVVGGANNFGSIPGAPAAPGNGATTLVTSLITGFNVRVSRNGLWQIGINPGDGDTFYTKVLGSNTLTFSSALSTGEKIIVETIPL